MKNTDYMTCSVPCSSCMKLGMDLTSAVEVYQGVVRPRQLVSAAVYQFACQHTTAVWPT